MKLLSSDTYAIEDIDTIASIHTIDGVVLGDEFCQRRMFVHGEADLTTIAFGLHRAGKSVVYRTPYYLTSRTFDRAWQLFNSLADNSGCSTVITNDIGFCNKLSSMAGIRIIWGQFASRNEASSLSELMFLKDLGVTHVELARHELSRVLERVGLIPLYASDKTIHDTVNRECLYIHEKGIWGSDCHRGCIMDPLILSNPGSGFKTTIDGHVLGRRFIDASLSDIMLQDGLSNTILYSRSVNEFVSRAF